MDVAYLYPSTDDAEGWTSSIPWDAKRLVDINYCPVSCEAVRMVCDGLVAVALAKDLGDNNESDYKTEEKVATQVVRFKYGKKTYQLSMTARIENATTNLSASSSHVSLGSRYRWFGSWFGIDKGSSKNINNTKIIPTEVLAQDRIAEALELETLKILHKGSLLYDSQSAFNDKEEQSLVSRALMKVSDDDWSSNHKKKATLVVMGTRSEHRLKEPPSGDDGVEKRGIFKGLVCVPFRLVYWPCKLAFHFVLSFFGPFLPSHMVPRALDEDRNAGDTESRPHQD